MFQEYSEQCSHLKFFKMTLQVTFIIRPVTACIIRFSVSLSVYETLYSIFNFLILVDKIMTLHKKQYWLTIVLFDAIAVMLIYFLRCRLIVLFHTFETLRIDDYFS